MLCMGFERFHDQLKGRSYEVDSGQSIAKLRRVFTPKGS